MSHHDNGTDLRRSPLQTPSIPLKKCSMFTPNISTGDSPSRCFDKNGIGTIARQELHSIFEVSSEDDSWHFDASLTYRILENILKRKRLRGSWTKPTRGRASSSTQNSVTSKISTEQSSTLLTYLFMPFILWPTISLLSMQIYKWITCNLWV